MCTNIKYVPLVRHKIECHMQRPSFPWGESSERVWDRVEIKSRHIEDKDGHRSRRGKRKTEDRARIIEVTLL